MVPPLQGSDRPGVGGLDDDVELVVVVFAIGVARVGAESCPEVGDALHS